MDGDGLRDVRLPTTNKRADNAILLGFHCLESLFPQTFQIGFALTSFEFTKPPEHPFKVGSTGQRLDDTLILRSESVRFDLDFH